MKADPNVHAVNSLNVSVTKEDQQSAYQRLLLSDGFTPDCIGKTNPYTGEVIRSASDYDLYLRERAFHVACESKYSAAAAHAISTVGSNKNVETHVKAERIRLDALDRQRRRAFENEYRLRCQKTFAVFAVLLILVCGAFSFTRYQKGYDAAESAYTAAAQSDYQQAYDLGYSDGKNNYVSQDTSKKSSGRASSAYDSPIIGNRNTKKFHSSDCSYLPSKSNQKPFDSYDDAVAAGYDACGHCGGR